MGTITISFGKCLGHYSIYSGGVQQDEEQGALYHDIISRCRSFTNEKRIDAQKKIMANQAGWLGSLHFQWKKNIYGPMDMLIRTCYCQLLQESNKSYPLSVDKVMGNQSCPNDLFGQQSDFPWLVRLPRGKFWVVESFSYLLWWCEGILQSNM